jgi:hypothetical protein
MARRPRILVFFDLDLTVRHFLQSGEIRWLEERFDVTYVFNEQPDARPEQRQLNLSPEPFDLPSVRWTQITRKRHGRWYPLYAVTALAYQRGTENYGHRRYLVWTHVKSERHVRRFERLSHPLVYPWFKRIFMAAMGIERNLLDLIDAEAPDALVYPSTLAGPYLAELARIAPRRNLPLITLMNSWDNPSSKAFPVDGISHLVVWGEQTRDHAQRYMRMPAERIYPFGAAQFEIYRQPVAESRAELAAHFDVPEDANIALYAGIWSGGHETQYLKELNAIAGSGALGPLHIIYRPHPWRGPLGDGEASFFDLDLPHVTMDPTMADYYRECVEQGRRSLFMADYTETARLLALADFTLSPMSTISLESILVGKPSVMLLARDTLPDLMENPPVRYRELCALEGAVTCEKLENLADACAKALAYKEDSAVRPAMANQRGYLVTLDGPRYMDRLADLIADAIGERIGQAAA